MRKVFLSILILGKVEPTKYVSDDFELGNAVYNFPVSYLINDQVKAGDDVLILTAVADGSQPQENYVMFKQEVAGICAKRQVEPEFRMIGMENDFDALTFNRFFRNVAEQLQEDDRMYVDITFGMKPYNISMFIAVAFMTKAIDNLQIETVMYAQKFSGKQAAEQTDTSRIYDLSALFYLNSIAGNLRPGAKEDASKLLNYLVKDTEG